MGAEEIIWGGIVLAGGSGRRMGAGVNKVLLPLCGEAVIIRSLRAILPHCGCAVLVARREEQAALRQLMEAAGLEGVLLADAGRERQDSVRSGLSALSGLCTHVLIHDGARCLVEDRVIRAVKEAAEDCGAAAAAIPVSDTIRRTDTSHLARGTVDRNELRAMQTPQAFAYPLIAEAHEAAARDGYEGTDDVSLVERLGRPVRLTEGSKRNIKLTTREDLLWAEKLMEEDAMLRVGQGYDVHALKEGRKLVLCGVEIPWDKGLDGHSDADVALHALMDALLGALALGDIGQHFPDTDERYRGISSIQLLKHVCQLLSRQGAEIVNADITIIAQQPKLMPYIPQMRQTCAGAMGISADRVSVKATTTEHLGFEGRMEGISSQAIVMIKKFAGRE